MNGAPGGPWAAAGLAFVAAALQVVALILLYETWREWRRRKSIVGRMRAEPGRETADRPSIELFREEAGKEARLLDRLAGRFSLIANLRLLLEQSGLGWRVSRFMMLTFAGIVVFGSIAYLIMRVPILASVPAAIGGILPYSYVRWKKKKRFEAFEQNFPEAIDLLGRAIRAGHAFSTGLQMVADEMGDPLGTEFRRVFDEQRFGLPVDDSLRTLCDRIDLLDVRIFVTAVLIQREVGGNLAEILDNLANTIRERFTIRRQIRVYTAQGRFTGYLLAALPIALAIILSALNPEYMRILIEDQVGQLMVAGAVVMQIFGYFIIRRIVDIEI